MLGKTTMLMKIGCFMILNAPLNTISSDEKSTAVKIFSAITIGLLSVLSFGLYAGYTYNFFANRKVGNLQKNLEKAIIDGNCNKVKNLLEKYPLLKTDFDVLHNLQRSHLSLMLPLAAEKGDIEMVKLLCDNGASLEGFSRNMKTALEAALTHNHKDVIKFLVERGARISLEGFSIYVTRSELDLNMSIYLLKKIEVITSEGRNFSILGLVASYSSENLDKVKPLIQLLIQKGDRLVEGDLKLKLADNVQKLIDNEIQMQKLSL